jgi:uncharacterized protein YajQ (UPF0234 family)
MSLNDFIMLHLDLVNLKINKKESRQCLNKDCKKEACFNYKNYTSINIRKCIYCSKHKLENMVNIKNKKCIKCNIKQPVFNYKNEKNALYCRNCRLENMINIKSKKCINCNIKRSNFNYENEKYALYCGDCKLENMINIISKKCTNCNIKHPVFNYKGKKNSLYCEDCKLENMINIKSKKCINCNIKRSNFNYENKKTGLYCGDCKLENMIDIKSKKCITCNIKQPVFNYENEKTRLYCRDCKLENMIDIKNKKCITCNNKTSIFNYENEKVGLYCGDCKLENMINIKDTKCKIHLCDTQVSNKQYKGYCLRCFIHNFPDSNIIRDYGTREDKVTEFIKNEFKDLNINYNKQIQGGCSQTRPDIFIDCLTHSVIIEVDEHQHKSKSYTPECEIQRINNLFTDLADRPIIFIRFNPDSYINKKGKLIKSCFEYTEDKGLPKANKTLQPRLNKLKENIEKYINEIPNINIIIIKLYYDGY